MGGEANRPAAAPGPDLISLLNGESRLRLQKNRSRLTGAPDSPAETLGGAPACAGSRRAGGSPAQSPHRCKTQGRHDRTARLAPRPPGPLRAARAGDDRRMIIAHLGAGASARGSKLFCFDRCVLDHARDTAPAPFEDACNRLQLHSRRLISLPLSSKQTGLGLPPCNLGLKPQSSWVTGYLVRINQQLQPGFYVAQR